MNFIRNYRDYIRQLYRFKRREEQWRCIVFFLLLRNLQPSLRHPLPGNKFIQARYLLFEMLDINRVAR